MDNKKYTKILSIKDAEELKNMDPLVREIFINLNECYYEDLKKRANKFLDTVFKTNENNKDNKYPK